jgi:hypothetical protein
MDRDDRPGSANNTGVVPPMGFPMNFGSMPMFPPGFQFPGMQQSQQE